MVRDKTAISSFPMSTRKVHARIDRLAHVCSNAAYCCDSDSVTPSRRRTRVFT